MAGVIGVGGQEDSSAESGCSGKYWSAPRAPPGALGGALGASSSPSEL